MEIGDTGNLAFDNVPFRQGTCAPRCDGGQVRYLNEHDHSFGASFILVYMSH